MMQMTIGMCRKRVSNPWEESLCDLHGLSGSLSIAIDKLGGQISVKLLMFDDSFHNRGPVLVISMPGMIKPSELGSFLMK